MFYKHILSNFRFMVTRDLLNDLYLVDMKVKVCNDTTTSPCDVEVEVYKNHQLSTPTCNHAQGFIDNSKLRALQNFTCRNSLYKTLHAEIRLSQSEN